MVEELVIQQPEIPALEPPFDASAVTPETVDTRRYYTLDQLAAMPAGALEELWLACPDRPFYEAALKRAVDDTFGENAVVSDLDQLSVIEQCILYYTGQHPDLPGSAPRIPTARRADGSIKWFKVSDRIRERLEAGLPLEEETPVVEKRGLSWKVGLGVAALGLVLICLVASVIRSATSGKDQVSKADMTATAAAVALLPHQTPTPTPLALEDIDRPIKAGEDLRKYYPVLLEIVPSQGLPRVFPVQQRAVKIAEWPFEPDPDVASAVLGLVIRPVLGIPYSPANAQFLGALRAGDTIHLRMSTGQMLGFRVDHTARVSRQEVSIFDQSQPGIALVLLQDTTADRLVIYGDYPAEQEAPAQAGGQDSGLTAEGASTKLPDGAALTAMHSYSSVGPAGASVPADWYYLLIDIRVEASAPLHTGSINFEVFDSSGGRYAPVTVDPSIARLALYQPVSLKAGDSLQATLGFLVPRSAQSPVLRAQAGDAEGRFQLTALPPGVLSANDLNVLVLGAKAEGTQAHPKDLLVRVRLYNPREGTITLQPADVLAVFSPVDLKDVFPIGPAVQEGSGLLPLTIQPGQAQDVELIFAWSGDPFAGLQVAGYRFVMRLR